jgi:hypothetical protein
MSPSPANKPPISRKAQMEIQREREEASERARTSRTLAGGCEVGAPGAQQAPAWRVEMGALDGDGGIVWHPRC